MTGDGNPDAPDLLHEEVAPQQQVVHDQGADGEKQLGSKGLAQVCRCILCLREGYWRPAEADVEETEAALVQDIRGDTP